jgi:hypothetical protein
MVAETLFKKSLSHPEVDVLIVLFAVFPEAVVVNKAKACESSCS